MNSSWCDLLPELLQRIANNLQFSDYVRFGAVCKSWNSITSNTPHLRALRNPWLLTLGDNLILYSPLEAQQLRCRNLSLPGNNVYFLAGTYAGCLIFAQQVTYILYNPFNDKTLKLPVSDSENLANQDRFKKVTFSSNPFDTSSEDRVIVVMCDDGSTMEFCRPGDEHWSVINGDKVSSFVDLMFFKELLYCVTLYQTVIVYEFSTGPKMAYAESYIALDPVELFVGQDGENFSLGELGGELILVIRYWKYRDDGGIRTIYCGVHKLDFSGPRWEEVESLGDSTLFVNHFCTMSADAADFHGLGFRKNCIYFTDCEGDECEGRVFSMDDFKIQPVAPARTYASKGPTLWIKPSS